MEGFKIQVCICIGYRGILGGGVTTRDGKFWEQVRYILKSTKPINNQIQFVY
jgi:hypothetical protein